MVATRPWTEFVAEGEDEPTVAVDLTIREMSLVLSCVDIDHVWDDYAVGFGIHRKLMAAIQTLMRSHDTKLVSKMMQAPTREPRRTRNKN